MQSNGTAYNIDWYFADVGAPFKAYPVLGSGNYISTGQKGRNGFEVPGAPRPWRNGSVPEYVGFDAHHSRPTAGFDSWWINGAPGPSAGGLRWDGSRGFTNVDGPGVFPPPQVYAGASCVSSTRGPLNNSLFVFPPDIEGFQNGGPGVSTRGVWFKAVNSKLFHCRQPGFWTCVVTVSNTISIWTVLRCISGAARTQVWIDPTNATLDVGETITITPF